MILLLATVSTIGGASANPLKVTALGACSVVSMTLFVAHSRRVAEPLVDLNLLRVRSFSRVGLIQFSSAFGSSATLVLVPLLVQVSHAASGPGRDAASSGFALAPFGVCSILAPLLVSRLRGRLGVGAVMAIGALAVIVGPSLLLLARDPTTLAVAAASLGFGIGLLMTESFDLIGSTAPADRVASLSSVMFVLRMIGSAFGSQISLSLTDSGPAKAALAIPLTMALAMMCLAAIGAIGLFKVGSAASGTARADQ